MSATVPGRSYWNHTAHRQRVRRRQAYEKTDGLLVSRWFWLGGLLSLGMWGGIGYAIAQLF